MKINIEVSKVTNNCSASVVTLCDIIEELRDSSNEEPSIELKKLDHKQLQEVKKSGILDAVMPSILSATGTNKEDMITYTGIIVADVDEQFIMPELFKKDPYLMLGFTSISGNGQKLFYRSNYTGSLEEARIFHEKYFFSKVKSHVSETYGAKVDESCKNINRLCYYGYDPDAYVNPHYRLIEVEEQVSQPERPTKSEARKQVPREEEDTDVSRIVDIAVIQTKGKKLDMTGKYDDWLKLGFFLAANFDRDSGLRHFKELSKWHPQYDALRCEKMFDGCLRDVDCEKAPGLTWFRKLCSRHKIVLPEKEKPKRDTTPLTLKAERWIAENGVELRRDEITMYVQQKSEGVWKTMFTPDVNDLWRRMNNDGIPIGHSSVMHLIESNFVATFNPFEDFFMNLPDAKGTDMIDLVCDHVPTGDRSHFRDTLMKWCVGVVRTALRNFKYRGVPFINQTAFILIGAAGLGKSQFFTRLFPEVFRNYWYAGIPHTGDKDTLRHLSDCIVIELPELVVFNRRDESEMSDLLTRDSINLRSPYAASSMIMVRHASFCGSGNNAEFLDATNGTRKYFVHTVTGKIDIPDDFDCMKFWSEVWKISKDENFKHWFTYDEQERLERMNDCYKKRDMFYELIQKYYEPCEADDPLCEFRTSTEILHSLRNYTENDVNNNPAYLNQIGRAMKQMNFKRVGRKIDGATRYGYCVAPVGSFMHEKKPHLKKKEEFPLTKFPS